MSLSKPSTLPERPTVPATATTDISVLPVDALSEILLRLDAKELCRLRLVCRLWRSLLSARHFADAHAARHPGPLIIATYKGDAGRDVLVDIMDLSGQVFKKVRGMPGDRAESVALDRVCVKKINNSRSSYRLDIGMRDEVHYLPDRFLDPATGAVHRIPDSYAEEHLELAWSLMTRPIYLFGRVASTGEYKAFRMLFHFSIGRGDRKMFEVCTLNGTSSSRWRQVPPIKEGIQFSKFTQVVMNGIIYFLCSDAHHSITVNYHVTEKDLIFTFNLETEAWGPSIRGPSITFPDDADQMFNNLGLPNVHQLTLANLNGFLAVVHGPAPYMDIWILLDMDKGLWVKVYCIHFRKYADFQSVHPLVLFFDGRIVLYKQDHEFLLIYDPRTNTLRNLVESKHFSAVAMYAGNLLSI